MLSKLESGKGQAVELVSADALREESVPAAQPWGPKDIDETVSPVLDDGTCPLAQIVRETSNRTEGLIENLQRFSARERIEQTDIDKHGKRRDFRAQTVNYVAHIEQRSSSYPV